jgi:hypothetical protein
MNYGLFMNIHQYSRVNMMDFCMLYYTRIGVTAAMCSRVGHQQISQSLIIYYQLFNLLQEVQDKEGKFKGFNTEITNATKRVIKKYDKYYTLIDDSCDILYIAMLLDPRFKKLILEHELKDGAEDIITAMQ